MFGYTQGEGLLTASLKQLDQNIMNIFDGLGNLAGGTAVAATGLAVEGASSMMSAATSSLMGQPAAATGMGALLKGFSFSGVAGGMDVADGTPVSPYFGAGMQPPARAQENAGAVQLPAFA